MGWYRVDVTLGGYSWTRTSEEPTDWGPSLPIRFGWERDTSGPAPHPPDHMFCRFGVAVEEAADLVDLADQAAVSVRVFLDPAGPFTPEDCAWSFYGRAAEPTAEPAGSGRGVLYEVNAVGYTVDLTGVKAGRDAYAPNYASTRLMEIFLDAGVTYDEIPLVQYAAIVGTAAREAEPETAWDLVSAQLRQTPIARKGNTLVRTPAGLVLGSYVDSFTGLEPDQGLTRLAVPVLHTYATDTGPGRAMIGTTPEVYGLDVMDPRIRTDAAPLPGVLAPHPTTGLLGVTVEPSVTNAAVDADHMPRDTTRWRRARRASATDVHLKGWKGTGVFDPAPVAVETHLSRHGTPTLEVEVETGAVVRDARVLDRLAETVLPDAGEVEAWEADVFTFHLDADPAGLPPMMPNAADHDPSLSEARSLLWTRAVTVAGMDPRYSPSGRDYVAGQLQAVTFTLETDGSAVVEFSLNRTVPRPVPYTAGDYTPSPRNYLAPVDFTTVAALVGATPADLDPAFTVHDYRLVRT